MALLRRIFALATLALISTAATSPPNPVKKDDSNELVGLNWSFYNIAALSTAVLVVSAGFAALTSLFLPLFVYKLCYLLGACRDTLDIYVDQFIAADGHPRKMNKRSIEYLEPILTTLVNAYEKYADNGLKKKFKKPRF